MKWLATRGGMRVMVDSLRLMRRLQSSGWRITDEQNETIEEADAPAVKTDKPPTDAPARRASPRKRKARKPRRKTKEA